MRIPDTPITSSAAAEAYTDAFDPAPWTLFTAYWHRDNRHPQPLCLVAYFAGAIVHAAAVTDDYGNVVATGIRLTRAAATE